MFSGIASKLGNASFVISVMIVAFVAVAVANRVGFVRNLVGPASA